MLTKKDFKAVAKIIKGIVGNGFIGEDFDMGWHDSIVLTTKRLADYFATQNPQFDRSRFMKACGLDYSS